MAVFGLICAQPGLNREHLATQLRLSPVTTRRAVRKLLAQGLIVEEPLATRRNKAGRPPCELRAANQTETPARRLATTS